jgi:methanogenic corrinoid protein MtbC1
MYTIKEAASRSGVSTALLRAWERRYGIVQPARTASGYRLYDEAAITRLRAMRRLVDDGWAPSTAATRVRDAGESTLDEILAAEDRASPTGMAAEPPGFDPLIGRFVEAAGRLDEADMEDTLDEMFARGSFERVATDLVMPALVALGDAWAAGRLDVAAEHAASSAVARRLGAAFVAAGRPLTERGALLIGMPPGSRHELGALSFAVAARRAGLPVRYLGADLPVPDWVHATQATEPGAAVIGAVTPEDAEAAHRVSEALHAVAPDLLIAFGGRASGSVPLRDRRHLRLPDELGAAVRALREATASD